MGARRFIYLSSTAVYGETPDGEVVDESTPVATRVNEPSEETIVAAWRSLSTLRDQAKLGEWLRGIARNLARRSRRKMRPGEQLDEAVTGDDLAGDAIAWGWKTSSAKRRRNGNPWAA